MKRFLKKFMCVPERLDGKSSLYRLMAIFGCISVFFQGIVWGALCIISMIFYGLGGPHNEKNEYLLSPYAYIFAITYYRGGENTDSCTNLGSHGLFILTIIYFILTTHVMIVSVYLLLALKAWQDSLFIRHRVTHWIIAVFVLSIWEFGSALIFFLDFLMCSEREHHYAASAAITLAALFSKGIVLLVLNISICISLCSIQYCGFSECPV